MRYSRKTSRSGFKRWGKTGTVSGLVLIIVLVLISILHFHNRNTPAKIVQGKIFSYQVETHGKTEMQGHVVFGTAKEGYGVIFYLTESDDSINEWNKSGKLASDLTKVSEEKGVTWSSSKQGYQLDWPNGLAISQDLEDNTLQHYFMSINKISGLFNMTLSGTETFVFDADHSIVDKVQLTQIGTLNESTLQSDDKKRSSADRGATNQYQSSEEAIPSRQENKGNSSNTIGENNSPNIKVTPAAQFSSFAFTNTSDKPITIDPRAIMPVLNYGPALKVPNEVLKEGAITIQPGQTHNYPNFFGNAVQNATSLSIALDTGGNVIWNWESSN